MKRLVLFVEGLGDRQAVPVLVKKLLTEKRMWGDFLLDPHPLEVGHIQGLLKGECKNWLRYLGVAGKRKELAAVLVVLDGDAKVVEGKPFCATDIARRLADVARNVRAGEFFSVAVVFACREFESWLIAGVESLAGRPLPDGRPGVRPDARAPTGDLEIAPRDAKKWLGSVMVGGYRESRDQKLLTEMINLDSVRLCGLRSFQRLEHALQQLIDAIRTNSPISTPGN